MMNVNKLKGKIVENGVNVDAVAEAINIDKSTFYRKLAAGGDNFTIGEADQIAKFLKLTKDEVNAIFFAQFVA